MAEERIENAFAKINLFLEVCGKREDGYHLLDTVMHTVSLCDEVFVRYDANAAGTTLTCDKKYIPTDSSNVAVKCADAFLRYTGRPGGAQIAIKKRIPVAAGLGGGSADGAAVLRALNLLTGARLQAAELASVGEKVGADIPFLVEGGCMRAEGIGEKLTPVAMKRKLRFVVAIGGRGSQTPAAYRALDERGYTMKYDSDGIRRALEGTDVREISRYLYNAFEEAVFEVNKEVRVLKETMLGLGAAGALMSGSGAAVFGIFEDAGQASRVCAALREKGYFAAAVRSV